MPRFSLPRSCGIIALSTMSLTAFSPGFAEEPSRNAQHEQRVKEIIDKRRAEHAAAKVVAATGAVEAPEAARPGLAGGSSARVTVTVAHVTGSTHGVEPIETAELEMRLQKGGLKSVLKDKESGASFEVLSRLSWRLSEGSSGRAFLGGETPRVRETRGESGNILSSQVTMTEGSTIDLKIRSASPASLDLDATISLDLASPVEMGTTQLLLERLRVGTVDLLRFTPEDRYEVRYYQGRGTADPSGIYLIIEAADWP